jgi:MFS family permease
VRAEEERPAIFSDDQVHPTGTPAEPSWRNRSSVGIGLASLLSDAGHEVPTSLLPSFLTSTLGAPAAVLGLIEGVSDALAGIARLAGGALADDPDRRVQSAVGGYTATAVFSSAIGLASSALQVGVLRASAWTARGLRVPSRNALLADSVPAEVYGRAYGFERAMDNLGAIVGPLLALVLVVAIGVRNTILVSVIPGLLAAAAVVYSVRYLPARQPRPRKHIQLHVKPLLNSPLRLLAPGITLFELGNVATTLLILRATTLLEPGLGVQVAATTAISLYAMHNLAATLVSMAAGSASDRYGSVAVFTTGVTLFALAYGGFAIVGASLPVLAVLFCAAGAGIGCVETAEHTAVATYSPVEARGSAFGLLAAVQSLGNFVASATVGLLWTLTNPTVAFGFAAAMMMGAAFGLFSARGAGR